VLTAKSPRPLSRGSRGLASATNGPCSPLDEVAAAQTACQSGISVGYLGRLGAPRRSDAHAIACWVGAARPLPGAPNLAAHVNSCDLRRMIDAVNIEGQRFGRLVAVSYSHHSEKRAYWTFRCDCGTQKVISHSTVKRLRTKSCGCLRVERARETWLRHGDAKQGAVTRLHGIWRQMLGRCNPDRNRPHHYAARGIRVCDEWRDYAVFKKWSLSNGYGETLSIERVNNDGNYEPSNCCWATKSAQARNRRTSCFLEFAGERLVIAEWGDRTGIKASTITGRLRRGWPPERALGFLP
jgi:hypothetical protein